MDDYCGDDSEEKNPYPANDYIGKLMFLNKILMNWYLIKLPGSLFHLSAFRGR